MKRARRIRFKKTPKAYTSGEVAVIKELQCRGIRFFTQQEIVVDGKKFIVDILIPPNVIVEIDGLHHLSSVRASRDEVKDETLRSLGFKVLRFQDSIARSQPSEVVSEILKNIRENEPSG